MGLLHHSCRLVLIVSHDGGGGQGRIQDLTGRRTTASGSLYWESEAEPMVGIRGLQKPFVGFRSKECIKFKDFSDSLPPSVGGRGGYPVSDAWSCPWWWAALV